MVSETTLLVVAAVVLALIVFVVVLAVLDALDVQTDCLVAGILWLVLLMALLWLVTR